MTGLPDGAVELAVKALLDEGGAPGNGLHGWRCSYPDRYGPCDCVRETAAAVLAAAMPALRAQIADEIEAMVPSFLGRSPGPAVVLREAAARLVRGGFADLAAAEGAGSEGQ